MVRNDRFDIGTDPMTRRRSVAEIVIGILYAIGAANQAVFTLRESAEFYQAMADSAWLPPSEALVEGVLVPNSVVVTVLVIGFEALAAIAILSRTAAVGPALLAGGVFSIIGAFTGNPVETIGYILLAIVHFRLASARRPTLAGHTQSASGA